MNFAKLLQKKIVLPILTVLLFAIYPVLALYAHNVDELILRHLLMPLVGIIVLAFTVYALWSIILRNTILSGIATVLFLILFWNYNLFFIAINKVLIIRHWHLVPLAFFIYFHLVYLLSKIKDGKVLNNVISIFLVPVTILISFNLFTIIPSEYNKYASSHISTSNIKSKEVDKDGKKLPDVYLIILDEFSSLNTIQNEWGYDNIELSDFLINNGFYIANKSEARHSNTLENLSTLLNLNYVTEYVEKETYLKFVYEREKMKNHEKFDMLSKNKANDYFQLISNNFLSDFFKSNGYTNIVIEGQSQHYEAIKYNNADVIYSYQSINQLDNSSLTNSPFVLELIRKTIIYTLNNFLKIDQTKNVNFIGTKFAFNYLKSDNKWVEGPKFIYAHIMCPHNPYIFDRNGNYISSKYNKPVEGRYVLPNESVNNAYLEQYIFVSEEIKSIVNSRLKINGLKNEIIIIQSDHGPRPHELYLEDKTNAFSIFNAVYFPDKDYSNLYDSIAPVNTLRVVLNKYFDQNFEMLEDR